MSEFSDIEYKKWANKQDRKILSQLNAERRKLETRLEGEASKVLTERVSLPTRIKHAISDRHIGEKEQIILLTDDKGIPHGLKYWQDLAEKGDKEAEARFKAFLIQEGIRAESVDEEIDFENDDKPDEEIEHDSRPRYDLLEENED